MQAVLKALAAGELDLRTLLAMVTAQGMPLYTLAEQVGASKGDGASENSTRTGDVQGHSLLTTSPVRLLLHSKLQLMLMTVLPCETVCHV